MSAASAKSCTRVRVGVEQQWTSRIYCSLQNLPFGRHSAAVHEEYQIGTGGVRTVRLAGDPEPTPRPARA